MGKGMQLTLEDCGKHVRGKTQGKTKKESETNREKQVQTVREDTVGLKKETESGIKSYFQRDALKQPVWVYPQRTFL